MWSGLSIPKKLAHQIRVTKKLRGKKRRQLQYKNTLKRPKQRKRNKKGRTPVNQKHNGLALLIGIEYLDYVRKNIMDRLPGCHRDISKMSKLLKTHFGYKSSNITVLWDARQAKQSQQPTAQNIKNHFKQLLRQVKKENSIKKLTIYYSGHGTQVRDRNGDEKDRNDEAMVPSDCYHSGMITDDWLNKHFVLKLPSHVTCYFVTDCCNSGTLLDLPYSSTLKNKTTRINKKPIPEATVISLSGCLDPQTSASAYNLERQKKWCGAMTWALVNTVLKSSRHRNIWEAWKHIRGLLSRAKFSQRPRLCFSHAVKPSSITFF